MSGEYPNIVIHEPINAKEGKCFMDWLSKIKSHQTEDKRSEVIEYIKKSRKPLVIYGTGRYSIYTAKAAMQKSLRGGGEITFLDPLVYYSLGKTMNFDGKIFSVVSEDEPKKLPQDFDILCGIIESKNTEKLKKMFPSCGYIEYLDMYSEIMPYCSEGYMDMGFIERNEAALREIYEGLADDTSRDVLENYLLSRITGNVSYIAATRQSEPWSYDWELIELTTDDVIIDGGAFIGDTADEIERYLSGCPKKIYAFEPDGKNFFALSEKFKERDDIVCVNAGLYDKDGYLSFSSGRASTSNFSPEGENQMEVKSLDENEMFSDVTVIKMDVEGSELAALMGAKRLIEKKAPKLAICIYHRNKDIIDIWKFLHTLAVSSRYEYYLRHHSSSNLETVLYAVQK